VVEHQEEDFLAVAALEVVQALVWTALILAVAVAVPWAEAHSARGRNQQLSLCGVSGLPHLRFC
jgi:hypothetical protein